MANKILTFVNSSRLRRSICGKAALFRELPASPAALPPLTRTAAAEPQRIFEQTRRSRASPQIERQAAALDALHICAAQYFDAELVSTERLAKPIYRAYSNISSIYQD